MDEEDYVIDYRETDAFKLYCGEVLGEIWLLGENAKYSTLAGLGQRFYDTRQWFNDAITWLRENGKISEREVGRVTYFVMGGEAVKPAPKRTHKEFNDDESLRIFLTGRLRREEYQKRAMHEEFI